MMFVKPLQSHSALKRGFLNVQTHHRTLATAVSSSVLDPISPPGHRDAALDDAASNNGAAAKGPVSLRRPLLMEEVVQGKSQEDLKKVQTFVVGERNGFLPREHPLATLPSVFNPLASLISSMPVYLPLSQTSPSSLPPNVDLSKLNGWEQEKYRPKGLLGRGVFKDACEEELAGWKGIEMERGVREAVASGNEALISALFRDYCFLTSAYLMEPVHLHFSKTGMHEGVEGRDKLPSYLARPLTILALHLGHRPFMEYASSYALVNYRLIAPPSSLNPYPLSTPRPQNSLAGLPGMEYPNMELIRQFQGGESEKGFVLTHLEMVSHSGGLIKYSEEILKALDPEVGAVDVEGFCKGLEGLVGTMRRINESMETMWKRSKGEEYGKLRSFIFGTAPGKGQNAMFPKGVVYEGVTEGPMSFRGESGANDSMIPLCDNLLEITASLPSNDLTKMLRDFRTYRPAGQREYVETVEHRARTLGVKEFAMSGKAGKKGSEWYLLACDQVREFRDRHWRFTKHYILRHSTFPFATGGSPILSYLPQNLRTVVNVMDEVRSALVNNQTAFESVGGKGLEGFDGQEVERCLRGIGIVAGREFDIRGEAEKTKGLEFGMGFDSGRGDEVDAAAAKNGKDVMEEKKESIGIDKRMKRGPVGCDGVG